VIRKNQLLYIRYLTIDVKVPIVIAYNKLFQYLYKSEQMTEFVRLFYVIMDFGRFMNVK